MIFLNGKIINSTDYGQALRVIRKQIVKTLEKKEIDPEMVISAAECLYNDVLNGKFHRERGAGYADDTEHVAFAAKLLRAQSLRKKVETELSGMPEYSGGGKLFLRVPVGVLLHIAAGNMEGLPAYSVLEGLLAGNINILKLPSGDNGISLFLLKKLTEYEPRLIEYIYILDTPSGDVRSMKRLMELSGAVAVWGSDETIKSVRRLAPPNVKIIEWGHKLGFAYIEDLKVPEKELTGLARHIFATDQLLCSSCQVIYLNTDNFEEVKAFGRRFAEVMKREGGPYGNPLFLQGRITVEMLTRKLERAGGQYCCYEAGRGSVTCLGDDKLELSGQYGNVLLKPLSRKRLFKSLYPYRGYLQTAGIYPKNGELIRILARCGLTNLYGLDEMGQIMIPGAHDGAFALREYSRIVEYSTECV